MTTTELVRRMESLGWKAPEWGCGFGDGTIAYDTLGDGFIPLLDQHARDLLACDFERWLIDRDRFPDSAYSDAERGWDCRVWTQQYSYKHHAKHEDKLTALITAAEAALGAKG